MSSGKKLTQEEFVTRAKNVWGSLYDLSLIEYKNDKTKITVRCYQHGIWKVQPGSFLRGGCGCRQCGIIRAGDKKRSTTTVFIEKAKKVWPNLYDLFDLSLSVYAGNKKYLTIVCKIHGPFKITPGNFLSGHGCSTCSHNFVNRSNTLSTAEFIRSAEIKRPCLYDLFDLVLAKYVNGETKIKIICKKHGVFKILPYNFINGQGCSKCNSSKGERAIREWLTAHHIYFLEQKKFKWCKNKMLLPYDFYIPSLNLLIEFNGEQHYKPISYFGGSQRLRNTQINDKIKTDSAKTNGYALIRIKYTDFKRIGFILKNYLVKQTHTEMV